MYSGSRPLRSRTPAPPRDDEFEQLSLYHATSGGEAALARKALGDSIRGAPQPPAVTISATAAE